MLRSQTFLPLHVYRRQQSAYGSDKALLTKSLNSLSLTDEKGFPSRAPVIVRSTLWVFLLSLYEVVLRAKIFFDTGSMRIFSRQISLVPSIAVSSIMARHRRYFREYCDDPTPIYSAYSRNVVLLSLACRSATSRHCRFNLNNSASDK